MMENVSSRQDRLRMRVEIERLRTVRCVMWSVASLMCFLSVAMIALMVYYFEQGQPDAARLFGTVLGAMFPSLATVMVAVSAIVSRK